MKKLSRLAVAVFLLVILVVPLFPSSVHAWLWDGWTVEWPWSEGDAPDWVIDGDAVYVDSEDAFISVIPHTIEGSGWVEVMFYTKSYSGPIDIVAGFEGTDGVRIKDVEIWESYEHTLYRTIDVQRDGTYTPDKIVSTKDAKHSISKAHIGSKDLNPNVAEVVIEEFDEVVGGNATQRTLTIAYDSFDGTTFRFKQWRKERETYYETFEDWNKTGKIAKTKVSLADCEDWQSSSLNNIVQPLTYYTARIWVDLPIRDLGDGTYGSRGKYVIGIKPSGTAITNAWLLDPWYDASWGYRVKITANSTKIDANVTNFPVLLYISQSSGETSANLTFIFEELGGNSQKFAVTFGEDGNECFSEVENWTYTGAPATNEAWIHASVNGTLASGADTDIYMYYDNTHANNANVGLLADGSAATEGVWDANYKMVLHMTGAAMANLDDSTSNNNDVTVEIGAPSYNQPGRIAYAVDFDGANDAFSIPDSPDFAVDDYTIEVWGEPDNLDSDKKIIYQFDAVTNDGWRLGQDDGGAGKWEGWTRVGGVSSAQTSDAVPSGAYQHVAHTRAAALNTLYVNGVAQADIGNLAGTIDSTDPIYIGQDAAGANRFDGAIDELRFSDIERSAAWLKASYYSGDDNLLTWGTEEPMPVIPTVTAFAASNVEETTVTLSGNVTFIGDTNITQRGFVYGTTSNSTTPEDSIAPPASYDSYWLESDNWTIGAFTSTANITGLSPGMCYYYRAAANNTQGEWGYSAELSFLTKPNAPTGLTCVVSAVGNVTLAWTPFGLGANYTYIRGKEGGWPGSYADGAYSYNGTGSTDVHVGVVVGETWYYAAWTWVTGCGESKYSDASANCSVSIPGPPNVNTLACSGVGTNFGIVNGEVTNVGLASTTITQRGFDYGLTNAYGLTVLDVGAWGIGGFTEVLAGLLPATVYHYRARALNDGGLWGYGVDRMFATKGSPVPYEHWNTTCNATGSDIYGANWAYQTFITDNASLTAPHSISSVKLDLRRILTPETLLVSIRHTAGGEPTGEDIAIGTIDADTFELTPTWYEIEMTPEVCLTTNTTYAIVLRALAGTATDYVDWEGTVPGTYVGGNAGSTTDSGVSWSGNATLDYCFELWGNPCLEVSEAKAVSGYIETGDWLIVCLYLNIAEPYYDDHNVQDYFYIQLVDPDDGSVKAQTKCPEWGYKPGAIYLSPAMVASLEWGKAYRVRLYGDYGANPYADYALQGADWLGTDLTRLDAWVRTTAVQMEAYYGVAFTVYIAGKGIALNEDGGVIFVNCIPALADVRPELFQIVASDVTWEEGDYTHAYADSLAWQTFMGTQLTRAFTTMGGAVGLSGSTIGTLIAFAIYAFAAVFAFPAGHAIAAIVLPSPILYFVWGTGMAEMALMGILLAVAVILFAWQFWWKG